MKDFLYKVYGYVVGFFVWLKNRNKPEENDVAFVEDYTNYLLKSDKFIFKLLDERTFIIKHMHESLAILRSWFGMMVHDYFDGEIVINRDELDQYVWRIRTEDIEGTMETKVTVERVSIYED